jgi:hypothetical protein
VPPSFEMKICPVGKLPVVAATTFEPSAEQATADQELEGAPVGIQVWPKARPAEAVAKKTQRMRLVGVVGFIKCFYGKLRVAGNLYREGMERVTR